jgi:hypothetical protein
VVARAWGTEKGRQTRGPMARPATGKVVESAAKAAAGAGLIEEHFVQNQAVSLCLLVNRRTRTMRVVDFRAGASQAKRTFVLRFAREQQIEKVYTLVERDEVSTWVKMGFSKEGNIPGFYKRSDAFLLGCVVGSAPLEMHVQEGEGSADDDDDPTDDEATTPAAVASRAAQDRAEKLLVQAKKAAKELAERLPAPKLAELREADARRAVDKAVRAGRALTAFEPFGRDVERAYFSVTARGGFELVASRESQSCFGNAFLELLTAPTTDAERLGAVASLRALTEHLVAGGAVSVFSLSPSDDLAMATAFVHNGFRRTGLLLGHLTVGGKRKDAIVWSKKLANPDEA